MVAREPILSRREAFMQRKELKLQTEHCPASEERFVVFVVAVSSKWLAAVGKDSACAKHVP